MRVPIRFDGRDHVSDEISNYVTYIYDWGHAVAQLVETLRYKTHGRGLDSRPVPLFHSVSNRFEHQEYFLGGKGGRCVGLTT